jgi:hypothetical protein
VRERLAEVETRLRRYFEALAAGTSASALAVPINEAEQQANALREELKTISPRGVRLPREQLNEMFDVLGGRISEALAAHRSPALLHAFYEGIGLEIEWNQPMRRLRASLQTDHMANGLLPTAKEVGGSHGVRGGTWTAPPPEHEVILAFDCPVQA